MSTTRTRVSQKKSRLLSAFLTGRPYTAKQIASAIKVSTSRARYLVTELRRDGNAIYRNRKGSTNSYRLGAPSKAIVAFAANHGGTALFC